MSNTALHGLNLSTNTLETQEKTNVSHNQPTTNIQ